MTQSSFQIQKILFPSDFSKSSEAVAAYVAGMADNLKANVSLLTVVPSLSNWYGASEPYFQIGDDALRTLDFVQKAAETSSRRRLEDLQKRYFLDVECSLCVKIGGVAESIVEYAQEISADLIMMPTRGSGIPRPFLIGSTTAKVLHDARCAVWISPHPRELEPFREYRQIICAIDYLSLSRNLLIKASQVAGLFKSRLSFVSSIPCPSLHTTPCAERQSVQSLKAETYAELQSLLKELQISASLHVLEGTVGEVTRNVVEREDGDLILIGRGHLEKPLGHLLTHAYEIIWESPCPVLSL